MSEITLEVSRREGIGKEKAKKLRAEGKVPAIVYGGHKESVAITVDRKSVSELVLKGEHGIRTIFLLKMAGSDQQRHAMIKDIQLDPISRKMKHIDFIRVVMDEVVRVTIPVHLKGLAIGVKNGGGILDHQVRELHVECLPGAIPDTFDVDVTELNLHQFIRIADLKIPDGVKMFDDLDRVIVSVVTPKVEVVAEEVAVAETEEPEVIKKGKIETATE
ncbi:MAG TPA: 50S ribosomal protein L25 [Thermoanaerobaculia bacterium]|nr:50S ribosomal protein L25 [Thermoanaerobaculia bacterium]